MSLANPIPAEVLPGLALGGPFRALIDTDPLAYFATDLDGVRVPSPYFDPTYYRAQNPDCPRSMHPLLHYFSRHLAGEERAAHPLFHAAEYGELNPDVAQAGVATLLHFARHGDAERRSPSHQFDASYYTRAYMPLEGTHPFRHYITQGHEQGHLPRRPERPTGALAAALTAVRSDCDRPLLLVGHDARQAGAPLLLRDLGRTLKERGWSPITLLIEGGPLVPEFEALGPCFNLAEGWDVADVASVAAMPTLASTVVCADVLRHMPPAPDRVLIVQEMVTYARDNNHLPALEAALRQGANALFLRPSIRDAYRDALPSDLPDDVLRPVLQGIIPRHADCATRLARARTMRGGSHIIGGGYGDHRKGFDLFLETAQRLYRQRPECRFTWLGEVGTWGRELLSQARGLPLRLPGFVDDYPAWLAGADLFLLTSRQDPGPTLVVESLLQGTALVYFDSDLGLKDVIAPHGTVVQSPVEAATAVFAELDRDTAALRRQRRQSIASQNDYARYVGQLEKMLSPVQGE